MTTPHGQVVHYVDHGGEGPPVLLLHSYLMDSDMFAPQVQALGGQFRLITMDERGHGRTPLNGPFDFWDVAKDALSLLEHLEIQRASVVGVSQGGFIAMRMALLSPEKIATLAVLGSSAEAEDPEVAHAYRQAADLWQAEGPQEELLDGTAAICLGDMDASEWKAKWRALPGQHIKCINNVLIDRDDIVQRLAEIKCPTLVLHGTKDAAYPVANAELIAARIPKAAPVVIVEGGEHFLSLTHPEAVNPVLAEHLYATV
ncbi:alpha/beta fold hydrolase [Streptomyces monticola]|uniref:Alpha/beta fold hydrolase n=1 Tax=Streptomyces monticola TaxID=2666263 RepID=A0ABW2JYN6_9ACTN